MGDGIINIIGDVCIIAYTGAADQYTCIRDLYRSKFKFQMSNGWRRCMSQRNEAGTLRETSRLSNAII